MVKKIASVTLQQLLYEWDHGKTKARERILSNFIANHINVSGPDLEEEFADAASLFLTRITTWLRLTYLLGGNINIQLDAGCYVLTPFYKICTPAGRVNCSHNLATLGQRYLSEFLEVGGILTLLEILGLKSAREIDKCSALQLLETISKCGRKYKEVICESYGGCYVLTPFYKICTPAGRVNCSHNLATLGQRYLSEFLEVGGILTLLEILGLKSAREIDKCSALQLLETISKCGRKYKEVICTQKVAAQGLRQIQKLVGSPTPSLVENVLALLRSVHSDVQYEASQLLQMLVDYEDVKEVVVCGLIALLTPTLDDVSRATDAPLAQHLQQAAAAKLLGILCDDSPKLAALAVRNGVVAGLAVVLSNARHRNSQQHAARTLALLVEMFKEVEKTLCESLGQEILDEFRRCPEDIHEKLSPSQLDKLIARNTQITLSDFLKLSPPFCRAASF
eukprot:sb/3464601/